MLDTAEEEGQARDHGGRGCGSRQFGVYVLVVWLTSAPRIPQEYPADIDGRLRCERERGEAGC